MELEDLPITMQTQDLNAHRRKRKCNVWVHFSLLLQFQEKSHFQAK